MPGGFDNMFQLLEKYKKRNIVILRNTRTEILPLRFEKKGKKTQNEQKEDC